MFVCHYYRNKGHISAYCNKLLEDFQKFNLSVSVALTWFRMKQQQSRQIWVKKGEKSLLVGYTSLKAITKEV